MDRKVAGVVFFGVVAVVTSPTTAQLLNVLWCSVVVVAVVVVVVAVVVIAVVVVLVLV